jgi:hypothetical protein
MSKQKGKTDPVGDLYAIKGKTAAATRRAWVRLNASATGWASDLNGWEFCKAEERLELPKPLAKAIKDVVQRGMGKASKIVLVKVRRPKAKRLEAEPGATITFNVANEVGARPTREEVADANESENTTYDAVMIRMRSQFPNAGLGTYTDTLAQEICRQIDLLADTACLADVAICEKLDKSTSLTKRADEFLRAIGKYGDVPSQRRTEKVLEKIAAHHGATLADADWLHNQYQEASAAESLEDFVRRYLATAVALLFRSCVTTQKVALTLGPALAPGSSLMIETASHQFVSVRANSCNLSDVFVGVRDA